MKISDIFEQHVSVRIKADGDCPKATQDIALNLKNRGSAIKTAMYGPLNPTQPNDEYWGKIADEWDVDVETAKKQRCGNCAVFIITPKMKKCISDGLVGDDRKDEWGAIDAAGELGYCEAFDFKCASKRTCRAWVSGGPILKEKTVEEIDVKKSKASPCWDGYKQVGMKKGKYGNMVPNCVPINPTVKSDKPLKDPKGGLTAAGRAHFNRTEGLNLKPGVKGPADTPEKMRRKGSFLTRFFTNPSGPMKDEKGSPTRLALSAAAWGEPVPQDRESASRLAEKGRRLLERYKKTKDD